jgi:hypothetical protein
MKFHSQIKEERTLTGLALSVHIGKVLVAGVDLFSRPALIPRKLLIIQQAKIAKTATKAMLSFSFHSVRLKRMKTDLLLLTRRITIKHEFLKCKLEVLRSPGLAQIIDLFEDIGDDGLDDRTAFFVSGQCGVAPVSMIAQAGCLKDSQCAPVI